MEENTYSVSFVHQTSMNAANIAFSESNNALEPGDMLQKKAQLKTAMAAH